MFAAAFRPSAEQSLAIDNSMIYFLSPPVFLKTIKFKIRCYLFEKSERYVPDIRQRAFSYVNNWRNWHIFQQGLEDGKDAEYFALVLTCLAVKDKLLIQSEDQSQQHDSYQRNGLFLIYCDAVDRLALLKKMSPDQAAVCKLDLRNRLLDLSD